MKKYLRLLRIKHWIKNILIFFPIIFSGKLEERDVLINVIAGFFAFSNIASVIYIINDIKDIEKDRQHPTKRNRPLAAGEVSKKTAMILIGLLLFLTSIILVEKRFSLSVYIYLILYLCINIAYSMGMKNIPLLDVIILGTGYLLRLFLGGDLAETGVSEWMFLTVLSASLFLGFGKRRNELLKYGNVGRSSLKKYNKSFLDKSMQLFLTLTIVFYSLCCIDKNTAVARNGVSLIWSVPIVMIICLRYNMILENEENDGDPVEVVLKDKFLLGAIAFYGITVFWTLYFM